MKGGKRFEQRCSLLPGDVGLPCDASYVWDVCLCNLMPSGSAGNAVPKKNKSVITGQCVHSH